MNEVRAATISHSKPGSSSGSAGREIRHRLYPLTVESMSKASAASEDA